MSDSAQKKTYITSELQRDDKNDIKIVTKVNEIPKTVGYFPEKPENLTESSTPEQSSSGNEGIVENTIEKICP